MYKELAKKAIAGEDKSFYQLIQMQKEQIYKIAYSYVNNSHDALDVVHDTVYKAYMNIEKLKKPAYFKTWLTRITINCAIDYLNQSKKVIPMEQSHMENIQTVESDRDQIIDLKRALDKLDEKSKTVVILRYFQDMPLKDISEMLDLPLSTVKSQLYRAMDKLKIQLEEGNIVEQ